MNHAPPMELEEPESSCKSESRKRIGGSRGYRLHSPFHRASVPSGPVTIGGAISREMEHAARLYSSEVEARPGRLLNSSRSAFLHHGYTPPFAALLSNGKQPCLQRERERERERKREASLCSIQLKINRPLAIIRDTSVVRSPVTHQFAMDCQ